MKPIELEERDYEALPASKNGRVPTLRESDRTNLAGVDTGRHTLSHTRLAVFMACPRKFHLEYLERLETVRRPRYFTLGSAYQKAIEYADPEVGVRFLNGFEPCEPCKGTGWLKRETGAPIMRSLGADACPDCEGRGEIGEQLHFHRAEDEAEHRVNEAIVRAASKLYLKRWPTPDHETREFEYKVRLRSPWTGAYSDTYDLLGYADGVIDPLLVPSYRQFGALSHGSMDFTGDAYSALGVPEGDVQGMLDAARAWEGGEDPPDAPLELVENKLVGRIESAKVRSLILDRQLMLERYGLWRATGRPVVRVWYRWVKKPSIRQREGRKKDKSDAETLDEFIERIGADYEERPEFYAHEEDPSFVTTKDLLRVEAELWELAEDLRAYLRNARDGRRRVFPRDTSRCSEYGGCQFIPICTGDPDARSLYQIRPKRSAKSESAPEAGQE